MTTFTVQGDNNKIKITFSKYITVGQYHEILKAINQQLDCTLVQARFVFDNGNKYYKGANVFIEPTKNNVLDLYDILLFILMI